MKWYVLPALLLALSLFIVAGCSSPPEPPRPTPTAAPPTPSPTPEPPSPYSVAEKYLVAWEQSRYDDMYALLSARSHESIDRGRFAERYRAITAGSTITSLQAIPSRVESTPVAVSPEGTATPPSAIVEVPFSVVMTTSRIGEIREENRLPLAFEDGMWRVTWTPALIFRELTGDNRVRFEPENPVRGTIYDRKGRPLATQGVMVSLGIVPGSIEDEPALLALLEQRLKLSPERVKAAAANSQPDWFVPLRDLSPEDAAKLRPELESIPGVIFRDEPARVYPNGPVAAHVVGYMTAVTAEEYEALSRQGYGEDDMVGRAGVEASAEKLLAGERGGKLSIVSPAGETVKVIAHRPARTGQDVHLSIDLDLQKLAEQSLGDQAGSVVMLDARFNSVLALASYPRFDPNKFITGFSREEWDKLNQDGLHPFQNRPVDSAYPIASTFKVVTMAAGLEKGGFAPESPFDCDGTWEGLGDGTVMGDWLPQGHGHLTLAEGLVRSCNIVFYEVGKKLDSIDPGILPNFANSFGFGRPTGLTGLPESAGLVPDPAWKQANRGDAWYLGDSVNLAIGQGFFLATPLQLANAYAAIARGGDLMTPVLVGEASGSSVQFKPTPTGSLPISPSTLDTIRQSMKRVTSDPNGTANYAFRGTNLSVAAKTGSAEVQGPDSHAWFASFAPADEPEIVLVVMVEEKGLGSEVAAPVARKILEGYLR